MINISLFSDNFLNVKRLNFPSITKVSMYLILIKQYMIYIMYNNKTISNKQLW